MRLGGLLQMKKIYSYARIGLLVVFCLMISVKVQPEFLKAAQKSEEKEYEEHTIYIGNEFRIPLIEGDNGYKIEEGGFYCNINRDYETKECVVTAEGEDDILFFIHNTQGNERKFLLHFVYGPYRWSKTVLDTLQKKSSALEISGLTKEELEAAIKGEEVKISKTGEVLTKMEFWLQDRSGQVLENSESLKYSVKNGKISFKFLKDGGFTLKFRITAKKKKQEIYYEDSCIITVATVGFSDQPFAVAIGGKRPAPLKNYTEVSSYTSSDESVAVVEEDGTIRGIAQGEAVITVKGTTINKTKETTQCTITVTKPKLEEKPETLISVYGSNPIKISGLESFSEVSVTSSNPKVLWGEGGSYYGVSYGGISGGTAKLIITVDGKELYSKKVTVYDPGLPELTVVAVGQKSNAFMDIKLPSKESEISYVSSDWSVVNVNKSLGRIKGALEGKAEITIKIDNFTFTVPVLVVKDKKIAKAANFAIEAVGTPYSQDKRMKEGYFDCSSFVWRSYKAAGVGIGGSNTYAPTAANMAKYMVEHGQEIKELSQIKAGDLIFNGGDSNSRYRGIWHVSMVLNAQIGTSFWTDEEVLYILQIEAGSGSGVYISSSYLMEEDLDGERITITRPIS